jgi:hypothetical protein
MRKQSKQRKGQTYSKQGKQTQELKEDHFHVAKKGANQKSPRVKSKQSGDGSQQIASVKATLPLDLLL